MNARQKVKKLKKEVEKLKEKRKPGSKWLRIDEAGFKQPEPNLYLTDISPFKEAGIFQVKIGQTILEGRIEPEDKVFVVEDSKIDQALDYVLAFDHGYDVAEEEFYSKKIEKIKVCQIIDDRFIGFSKKLPGVLKDELIWEIGEQIYKKGLYTKETDPEDQDTIRTETIYVDVVRK